MTPTPDTPVLEHIHLPSVHARDPQGTGFDYEENYCLPRRAARHLRDGGPVDDEFEAYDVSAGQAAVVLEAMAFRVRTPL